MPNDPDPFTTEEPPESFTELLNSSALAHAMYHRGASPEQIAVALYAENLKLRSRVIELESIAPKKMRGPDGKVYVWQCPAEFIPEQTL